MSSTHRRKARRVIARYRAPAADHHRAACVPRSAGIGFPAAANTLLRGREDPLVLKQLPLRLRSVAYALRGGFLVRPLVIAIVLGLCGAVLSSIEETTPVLAAWIPATLFPSHDDPQVAQTILSVIATSIMTV